MLEQFGFTQYESKVYQSLVAADRPLDATGIAKQSGVPRSKIYDVLFQMGKKGITLETTTGKKRYYTALPLESVIEKLTSEFAGNIEALRNTEVKEVQLDDRVWTLKNDQSIKATIDQLLQQAKKSIIFSGWADDLEAFVPSLEKYSEAGKQVSIHSVGPIDTNIPNVTTLIPDARHANLELNRIVIIDECEMLFAGVEDGEWQSICTKSRPLVKFFIEFFYHDLTLTKVTNKYHDQLINDAEIRDLLLRLRY